MWWATGPNNNGHTGWLAAMQKLGLDELFASINFIPQNMTRGVTPLIEEGEIVGTIDYDVMQASNGAVVLPIPVEGKEEDWKRVTEDFANAHPGVSTNYTEDGSYTRLREVNMGINLDRYLPMLKIDGAISGLRIFCLRPKMLKYGDPKEQWVWTQS